MQVSVVFPPDTLTFKGDVQIWRASGRMGMIDCPMSYRWRRDTLQHSEKLVVGFTRPQDPHVPLQHRETPRDVERLTPRSIMGATIYRPGHRRCCYPGGTCNPRNASRAAPSRPCRSTSPKLTQVSLRMLSGARDTTKTGWFGRQIAMAPALRHLASSSGTQPVPLANACSDILCRSQCAQLPCTRNTSYMHSIWEIYGILAISNGIQPWIENWANHRRKGQPREGRVVDYSRGLGRRISSPRDFLWRRETVRSQH